MCCTVIRSTERSCSTGWLKSATNSASMPPSFSSLCPFCLCFTLVCDRRQLSRLHGLPSKSIAVFGFCCSSACFQALYRLLPLRTQSFRVLLLRGSPFRSFPPLLFPRGSDEVGGRCSRRAQLFPPLRHSLRLPPARPRTARRHPRGVFPFSGGSGETPSRSSISWSVSSSTGLPAI